MKIKLLLAMLSVVFSTSVDAQIIDAQTNHFERLEIAGKIYSDCTVRQLNPAQAMISIDTGGSMVAISNLPPKLQQQFNYDPVTAEMYLSKRTMMDSNLHASENAAAANASLNQLAQMEQMKKSLNGQIMQIRSTEQVRLATYNSKQAAGLVTQSDARDLKEKNKEDFLKINNFQKQIAGVNYQELLLRQQNNLPGR